MSIEYSTSSDSDYFFMSLALERGFKGSFSFKVSNTSIAHLINRCTEMFDEYHHVNITHIFVRYDAIVRIRMGEDRVCRIVAKDWWAAKQIFNGFNIPKRTIVSYYHIGKYGVSCAQVDLKTNQEIYTSLFGDLDVDVLCEDFMASQDAILLLYGEPGIGKTTLLKYLIERHKDLSIAYIKDVQTLSNGHTWEMLQEDQNDFLILDDINLDFTRDEKTNFVEQILSFSDGIFGKHTKTVITTNTAIKKIDRALVRPGRCFDFIFLKPLTKNQAVKIWVDELKCNINDLKIENSITQADLMQQYQNVKDNRTPRRYLPEDERCTMVELLKKSGVYVQDKNVKLGL